jgi:hypothetical protein
MKKKEKGIYAERGVSPFQFDPLSYNISLVRLDEPFERGQG